MSIFTERIKTNPPNKSAFDLSHEFRFTCAFGQLIPIFWEDIIPGDSFRIKSNVLLRMAPLLAPLYHRIDVFLHFFFVRYGMVMRTYGEYGGFDSWFTEDPTYDNSAMKYITINNTNKGYFNQAKLPDYMGLPIANDDDYPWGTVTQDIDINALPFLAYQLIWDEYYRDQNLQDDLLDRNGVDIYAANAVDLNPYIDEVTDLKFVNYEKDYFTSALTTAYKGLQSDVEFDIEAYGRGADATYGVNINLVKSTGAAPTAGALNVTAASAVQDTGPANMRFKEDVGLGAYATIEIMELRRAEALMRYYEAANRGGHRYHEQMLAVFGVITDDSRHSIPQYIGGGRLPIQISEVVSQAETLVPSTDVVSTPLGGSMAGHGKAAGSANQVQASFSEHGVLMGLLFVRPRTGYSEGIDRFWRKLDQEDFYNPYLQHIGDQAILQSEIYYDDTGSDADDVFGYAPRWAEYKWKKDRIAGEFHDSMDHWHMVQQFGATAPSLNEDFIKVTPARDELQRIYSFTGLDQLYIDVYNDVRAIRPMDKHDIGGNVQH